MLIDSNIIIYAAQPSYSDLRQFIAKNAPVVSAVSYVEVLGFHKLSPADRDHFARFFSAATIVPITQPVLDQAVLLRQQRKMTLGDALIAGTCLVNRLTLVTHNVRDFTWITGLNVLDPLPTGQTP